MNWPPIDLKRWQANYLSPYLAFDISLDISNETFIFVVMEVIWGRIFGHSEAKWPLIDLKCWQVNYWSPYLSFDMSLHIGYETLIFVVSEVIWGRIFDHSEVKWTKIDLKYWQVNFWSRFSFIWYVARHRLWTLHYITTTFIFVVMEVTFSGIEIKWPPMGI